MCAPEDYVNTYLFKRARKTLQALVLKHSCECILVLVNYTASKMRSFQLCSTANHPRMFWHHCMSSVAGLQQPVVPPTWATRDFWQRSSLPSKRIYNANNECCNEHLTATLTVEIFVHLIQFIPAIRASIHHATPHLPENAAFTSRNRTSPFPRFMLVPVVTTDAIHHLTSSSHSSAATAGSPSGPSMRETT